MATKNLSTALASKGFTPVAVKARKTKSTDTVTVQYNAANGSVTFKLGADAREHFGETVDVYVNAPRHSIALVPTSGAPTTNTATFKSNGFRVAAIDLPPTYLLNKTYTPDWDPNGIAIIILEGATVTEATPEFAEA